MKFQKATILDSHNFGMWKKWGYALELIGKPDEAIRKFEKMVKIKTDYVDGWINWATALLKMGRFEDALKKYEKALSLNPKMLNVKNRINEIKKLIESKEQGS